MNKRIRILFTISNFNTAGSGKVVYDLVSGLDKNKFDVEIACGSDEGDFFKIVKALGLPINICKTKTPLRPYYSLIPRILKIARFYKKQNYHIIHSWEWSSDWTEVLAARFAGVKWLYTKKAMGFKSKHWKIKSYLADFIITINDEMQNYFPYKKAQELIPLGIDSEYYSPTFFGNKISSISSNFEIITVANLVPVKGIEVLIRALHNLNDSTYQLTILGDYKNDYGTELIQLVEKLNLEHQVHFKGKLLDVRQSISESNLYVIPTLNQGRKEGMPMALVEAMCMGIPVLGSDISGINYVLKEYTDLLFSPGDSKDLSLKIKNIRQMSINERAQLGESLRDYCLTNFSMNSFIKSHELLYKRLLKR
ncbi:glycosyltransferase [Ichthyenterobacterium sp. W332]|uniref:Glycosyltransferase n=1 Tax=Microcosmobacter mediterraneus TaxID=3075607 RepID=A0ABU2YHI0_9FLAO|nr:glycosyltransferase [Ichthyenterobacterium sp. W332]MDT0557351.1 glycosyltransferase [Ichthyenterobacterium sp. W332]